MHQTRIFTSFLTDHLTTAVMATENSASGIESIFKIYSNRKVILNCNDISQYNSFFTVFVIHAHKRQTFEHIKLLNSTVSICKHSL